jgi:hypothetical protein
MRHEQVYAGKDDLRHRRSVVGQQHQTGMIGLGNVRKEIKPSVVVEQERFGVSLLGSNIVRTLERVPDEENREVQADKIVVSVLGIELDGVTSRVPRRVGILSAVRDSRETAEDRGFLADGGEEGRFGKVADVLGDDKLSESSPSAGMYDALLDFRSVECLTKGVG